MNELHRKMNTKDIAIELSIRESIRRTSLDFLLTEAEGKAGDEELDSFFNAEATKAMKNLMKMQGVLDKGGFPTVTKLIASGKSSISKSLTSGGEPEKIAGVVSSVQLFLASISYLLASIAKRVKDEGKQADDKPISSDDILGKKEIQKLITTRFAPTPMMWNMMRSIKKAAGIEESRKRESILVESILNEDYLLSEDDFSESINEHLLNEGLLDWFLKLFDSKTPPSATAAAKALNTLFKGNIVKALTADLEADTMKADTIHKFVMGNIAFFKNFTTAPPSVTPPKVDTASGADGGVEAGVAAVTNDQAVAKQISAAASSALGDRASGVTAAIKSIGDGTDVKQASSKLSDEDKELLKAIFAHLGPRGKDSKVEDVVAGAIKEVGIEGEKEDISGGLKYSKHLDVEKIKRIAGDKGPKAVDSLLGKSDELRKKLGIKDSRNRAGNVMTESMYSFLFEEVDDAVVKAFKDGLTKDVIDKEITDDEAKEIAQSIIDKTKPADESEKEDKGDNSLSSMLFTQVDNNDKSKGFKLKMSEPGSKASTISTELDNLVDPGVLGSWPKTKAKPNSANRTGFAKTMGKLKAGLDGVKLESIVEEDKLILERWQKFAGLIK